MSQFPPPTSFNPYEPFEPSPAGGESGMPEDAPRRGKPIFVIMAWTLIFLIGNLIFWTNFVDNAQPPTDSQAKAEMQQVDIMAKTCIGMANMPGGQVEQASKQVNDLNDGPLEQRYCFVLLRNEFEGPATALDDLEKLETLSQDLNYTPSVSQQKLAGIIRQLLSDYDAGNWAANSVSPADKEYLKDQLSFSGRIGLAPSEGNNTSDREQLISEAIRSTTLASLIVIIILLGGVAGLGCFGLLIALTAMGKIRPHFENDSKNGRIYAETFAVWMVMFVGLGIAAGTAISGQSELIVAGVSFVVFFGSLIGLAWPCLRGIPFQQVCRDIGWYCKNPIKEIGCGIFAYLANLPVMVIGFAMFLGLMAIDNSMKNTHELEPVKQTSHPIVEQIAAGDIGIIFFVLLTACVGAPVVEETVFRGVLYRHLRELSRNTKRWISVIIATLVNSFVFAAIHPQGWTAIPVLAALAVGFSWAREWRGSLVAPMTMHAMNNGFIGLIMLTFMI